MTYLGIGVALLDVQRFRAGIVNFEGRRDQGQAGRTPKLSSRIPQFGRRYALRNAAAGEVGTRDRRRRSAASRRELTSSFESTDETWRSTVFGERKSWLEISEFERPCPISPSTSDSRRVRRKGFALVSRRCPRGIEATPIARSLRATSSAIGRASNCSNSSRAPLSGASSQ